MKNNTFLNYLKNTSEKAYLYSESVSVASRNKVLKHFVNIMNTRADVKLKGQSIQLPMEFSNSYGTYEGLLFATSDFRKMLRVGWRKGSKTDIDIIDIWMKPGSLYSPDKTVIIKDSNILNIVQLVNEISNILNKKNSLVNESVYFEGLKKTEIKEYLDAYFTEKKIRVGSIDFKTAKILKGYTQWIIKNPIYPELSFHQINTLVNQYKSGELEIGINTDIKDNIKIVKNIDVKTKTDSENEKLIEELKREGIYDELTGEETFSQITKLARGLAKGITKQKLLILAGDPGLGKTEEVTEVLDSVHGKDNWGLEKSKITALEIYKSLYEWKDSTLVLDDIDVIFKDEVIINLLKTATDTGKERWLGYKSSILDEGKDDKKKKVGSSDESVPKKFLYNGTVIIVTNLYFRQLPSSLLSRSLKVEVDFTPEQSLSRIKSKLNVIYPECPMEVKLKVWDFLNRIKTLFEKLDFRKFFSCCSLYLIEGMEKSKGDPWMTAQLTDEEEKTAKKYMINMLRKGEGGVRK